jgi:hypothetical protein
MNVYSEDTLIQQTTAESPSTCMINSAGMSSTPICIDDFVGAMKRTTTVLRTGPTESATTNLCR